MNTAIWIQAIGGFFLFGTTVFLVMANWNLVREMRKDREERMKPYVVARMLRGIQNYIVGLANFGGSPAYDIEFSYKPDFIKGGIIKTLRQKDEICVSMGDELAIRDKTSSFQVNIKYKNRLGNLYNETFKFGLAEARMDKDRQLLYSIDLIGGRLDCNSKTLQKSIK